MANIKRKTPHNINSEFFVDDTCINCGTCYWIAPDIFEPINGQSAVTRNPSHVDIDKSYQALLSCPTNSIGFTGKIKPKVSGPFHLEDDVYTTGYHSENSFGATSYLILGDANILIDSPRYLKQLSAKIHQAGGLTVQCLTHQDDIADAELYHKEFQSTLYYPKSEKSKKNLEVDEFIEKESWITPDLLAIPTPGHTKGHFCYLYKNKYLFTGDHLCYSNSRGHLIGFKNHCWYSVQELRSSIEKLKNYEFNYILPGHGSPIKYDSSKTAHAEIDRCLKWFDSN